ncbi:NADH-quinone oxidoreductase subunit NuoE [Actinospica acidithermotolerans]|uniref:NADH-quinone oxidoreductase subunit NuoE n=1 Tax=Actinospica acidithermotolerans TaxID=2828514 RepID=UPI002010E534|nr:NADH-quinone oxidoreductase subunit NuoE [Actinospica acidithermotolerans]
MSTAELGLPAVPAKGYPQDVKERLDQDADAVIARYPVKRSALLPLLHLVQSEEGFVSGDGIKYCADKLDLTTAEVSGVATFYSMYKRRQVGDYHVGVCTNTLCAVLGGDEIFATLKEHLGVENDQRTEVSAGVPEAQGKSLTLEHIECNAACDFAPVMTVNWELFDNMTPEKAKQLVDDLLAGREVVASRGPAVCSFRETERILAGFEDRREDAVHGGTIAPESIVGLRVAQARGESA